MITLISVSRSRWIFCLAVAAFLGLFSGCSVLPQFSDPGTKDQGLKWIATSPSIGSSAYWQHRLFPGKKPTTYRVTQLDGHSVIEGKSTDAASMLRQSVGFAASQFGHVDFSWKVPQLIAGADLTRRETHDSPVRLTLTFAGDRSLFSPKNAMLSELARTLTGEELPYATLVYVWCNQCDLATVQNNPRVDRIREIALESGPEHLGKWLHYRRDLRADFLKAFGELPGALLDVGLMTDTDNTHQEALAWYGPVYLSE